MDVCAESWSLVTLKMKRRNMKKSLADMSVDSQTATTSSSNVSTMPWLSDDDFPVFHRRQKIFMDIHTVASSTSNPAGSWPAVLKSLQKELELSVKVPLKALIIMLNLK